MTWASHCNGLLEAFHCLLSAPARSQETITLTGRFSVTLANLCKFPDFPVSKLQMGPCEDADVTGECLVAHSEHASHHEASCAHELTKGRDLLKCQYCSRRPSLESRGHVALSPRGVSWREHTRVLFIHLHMCICRRPSARCR